MSHRTEDATSPGALKYRDPRMPEGAAAPFRSNRESVPAFGALSFQIELKPVSGADGSGNDLPFQADRVIRVNSPRRQIADMVRRKPVVNRQPAEAPAARKPTSARSRETRSQPARNISKPASKQRATQAGSAPRRSQLARPEPTKSIPSEKLAATGRRGLLMRDIAFAKGLVVAEPTIA